MVRDVRCFNKRNEVWPQLSHSPFHCTLHSPVRAWSDVASVINCSTILEKFLKTPNFAYKFHQLTDARVTKSGLLATGVEEVELQVLHMLNCHLYFGGLEPIIVFELS